MADRETLFGTDLQVAPRAPGFDLVSNNLGDVRLASGAANIEQALTLRLSVRVGELTLLGWPDYGSRLHELIGEPNNRRTQLKLMAFARDAVERDPRVEQVQEVRAEVVERTTVRLSLDVILIHQQNPLNLVFDVKLEAP